MKTKNILAGGLLAALALIGLSAHAEDKTPGSGPNPFTDCGIGAALFPNTGWAAVTSNVIWDIGITAIISATASPQTCQGKRVSAALFIHTTYVALSEEAAAGRGEHLTTVLDIFGCKAGGRPAAVQVIRSDMARLVTVSGYADQAPREKSAAFFEVIEGAVSATCAS